ncbi:MAG: enoyl-CoA hydratase/isomerase family protein, partial [Calditrichota bacterium]
MKSRPQKPLLFEKLDYAYLLQFNRPAVHNAVNDVMMQALEAVLDKLEAAKDSLPVIISHVGNKTFCAGGDLKYFSSLDTPEKCRIMSLRMQSILDRLENCGHFVILAAKGQILGGGCEILTACHYAIVADNSQLSFRQAPNGIITGWGGGRRLIRKIGRANALRLTLSGERLSAEAAQRIGLAEEVIPIDEVLERAK